MPGTESRTRIRKSPGGAPRGARPDRKGRGRLASARHVGVESAFTRVHSASKTRVTRLSTAQRYASGASQSTGAPIGAPPAPHRAGKDKDQYPGAQTRRGNAETWTG